MCLIGRVDRVARSMWKPSHDIQETHTIVPKHHLLSWVCNTFTLHTHTFAYADCHYMSKTALRNIAILVYLYSFPIWSMVRNQPYTPQITCQPENLST